MEQERYVTQDELDDVKRKARNAILVLNKKIDKLTKEVQSLDGVKGFLVSTGASVLGDAIFTKLENK